MEMREPEGEGLGDVAARLDAERFVGRRAELAMIDAALEGASSTRLFYVFGPGGIGKSALLRQAGRMATAGGRTVHVLDGRVLPAAADVLEAALEPAFVEPRPVVIVDEMDRLVSLRHELRQGLLTRLPADAVVLLAGRRRPDRAWFEAGLEHLAVEVPLHPLDSADARALLGRYGIDDDDQVGPVLTWAAGYPLPLTLAARVVRPGWSLPPAGVADPDRGGPTDDQLADLLLVRLAGDELDGIDPAVLEVAAVAPAVDARLLAAVLPGKRTRSAMAQLRELSVSERIGHRTTLHRLVRDAVRTRLRSTEPERYRTLVLRVAEHLRARVAGGEVELAYELADLIENPMARVGFGPSDAYYVGRFRPQDLITLGTVRGALGTRWWRRYERWCEDHPEQGVPVRHVTGELAAMVISGGLDRLPEPARHEIECGPVYDYARRHGMVEQAVFVNDLTFMHDVPDEVARAEMVRVGNAALIGRSGLSNPRFVFATGETRTADDGTEPFGYEEVPELRRSDDERALRTWMVDFGPGGAVGRVLAMIRAEQGVTGDGEGSDQVDRSAALLVALRSFHDDDVMGQSSLGESAEQARAVVRQAVRAAFGWGEDELLLRTVLERTYLDADGGHAVAMAELPMSRSSFYRHLQRARDRLASTPPPSP